jgi:hypothetical protein
MKLTIINLGRNKINGTFEIKNGGRKAITDFLKKYILSGEIFFSETEKDSNIYDVIVGIRTVGQIKIEKN